MINKSNGSRKSLNSLFKNQSQYHILQHLNQFHTLTRFYLIYTNILIISSHLSLVLPSGRFPSCFLTKILSPFLCVTVHPVHLITLCLIILIFVKQYTLFFVLYYVILPAYCYFPSVTWSTNILFRTSTLSSSL